MATTMTRGAARGSASRLPRVEPGISVRQTDAADTSALSDFYAGLSPSARRDRFLGTFGDAALESAVRRLSEEPGWVAVRRGGGSTDGAVVGHVVLVPIGARTSELAVAVSDGWRGQGIGTRLVEAAAAGAREAGIARLLATTSASNEPMRRLMRHAGRLVRDVIEDGFEELEVALV